MKEIRITIFTIYMTVLETKTTQDGQQGRRNIMGVALKIYGKLILLVL